MNQMTDEYVVRRPQTPRQHQKCAAATEPLTRCRCTVVESFHKCMCYQSNLSIVLLHVVENVILLLPGWHLSTKAKKYACREVSLTHRIIVIVSPSNKACNLPSSSSSCCIYLRYRCCGGGGFAPYFCLLANIGTPSWLSLVVDDGQ